MSPERHKSAPASPGEEPASEFLLSICHDLRSCLRAIQPHAELLQKRGETAAADAEKHLSFILDGARRLDLLADGLAGYAMALQADRAAFRVTSLETALRGVLMKLDRDLHANDATVSYDKLPQVSGDPDRLSQVFEILLRHCLLRRGETAPLIHIGAGPHAEGWLCSVRDNLPALGAAYLERLFQPFERLDSRTVSGPGLGLATCRTIVERHGGRMWAEADGATGSTFWFTLPRATP